ncbi:MAG: peroxisomal membrane protein pex14 [Alyxoria varia]|nr:MAG: peroxisomal membrane protein pex14 [Alyxoria varia]
MAIREDLVSSAVTFLQDPSVEGAPLEKRIAFLQSKNLTQEEINVSLSRAGDINSATSSTWNQSGYRTDQRPAFQQHNDFGPYSPGYWQQSTPPQVPRRDWRDYFIMATLMSSRYVVPLIAPPTPPQLEQDKTAIDQSFERAFGLIEQLSSDTAEIKTSEEGRKEKLDTAIIEFETAIQELKEASHRRDDDTRRINDEVKSFQDMIPRAMKAQEENSDARLKELTSELKGLKTLIANRLGTGGTASSKSSATPTNSDAGKAQTSTAANGADSNTSNRPDVHHAEKGPDQGKLSPSPYGRRSSSKGGIPAWQLAASKKQHEPETSETISTAQNKMDSTEAN